MLNCPSPPHGISVLCESANILLVLKQGRVEAAEEGYTEHYKVKDKRKVVLLIGSKSSIQTRCVLHYVVER